MARYFIEVGYLGTTFAGFQKQHNANTVQAEVEKAMQVYFRKSYELTGSSRTDAGVHAVQNYFHFDDDQQTDDQFTAAVYHLNAILPADIAIRNIRRMKGDAHCRFEALSRTYHYMIYSEKEPFLKDRAFYYPYPLDLQLLNEAARLVKNQTGFEAFSKKNTQVFTFLCEIKKSEWVQKDGIIRYEVEANRFLRGMVRGLAGTMLKVGRQRLSLEEFEAIFTSGSSRLVDFSVPACGLVLKQVKYPLAIEIDK